MFSAVAINKHGSDLVWNSVPVFAVLFSAVAIDKHNIALVVCHETAINSSVTRHRVI